MSDPPAGSAPARARVVAIIALVVAIAAGALIALGLVRMPGSGAATDVPGGSSTASGATTALVEAGQIAVDFTSFDYKTLTQDQAQIATHLTPTFRQTYLAQSRPLNSVIQKAKAVATSDVVASGLSSYDPAAGTATAIVAVNVTSRNVKTQGTLQYYRFSVQLQRQGSTWLASNVIQE